MTNNPLFGRLSDKLEARFSREYINQTVMEWAAANTTLRGVPFSCAGYEFQREIMNDMHPNMDVIKCSQIGLTEVQIRKACSFVCRNRGVSAIFSLPDENLFRKVSQTRVKPLIEKDAVFNKDVDKDSVRSMSTYQFGSSFLYLMSCSESSATSTAADMVLNDELDLSPQNMIALFNSRLQNSDYKISQRFSTPSFPSFGIDAGYKASDQRLYLTKCAACNHWQWPEFDLKFCHFPDLPSHIGDIMELDADAVGNMDLNQCFVRCEKCERRLTGERFWVAKHPGRTNARGYYPTPFSTSRLSLAYMVQQLLIYKKNDYLRGFYNTTLGKTYSDARTQIPEDLIKTAMGKGTPNVIPLPKDTSLVIGIDMGQTCHLVVGDTSGKRILLFEAVPVGKIVARVKELKEQHKIVAGAVDRLPYTPTSEEIMRLTNGIVIPVQYGVNKDTDMKLMEDEYGIISHASVNRTKILDIVANGFREFQWELSGYSYQTQVVIEHLRDMVRDEKPETPATWVKLTGNDHYFHALALYSAALRLRPMVIDHIAEGQAGSEFSFGISTIGGAGPGLGLARAR